MVGDDMVRSGELRMKANSTACLLLAIVSGGVAHAQKIQREEVLSALAESRSLPQVFEGKVLRQGARGTILLKEMYYVGGVEDRVRVVRWLPRSKSAPGESVAWLAIVVDSDESDVVRVAALDALALCDEAAATREVIRRAATHGRSQMLRRSAGTLASKLDADYLDQLVARIAKEDLGSVNFRDALIGASNWQFGILLQEPIDNTLDWIRIDRARRDVGWPMCRAIKSALGDAEAIKFFFWWVSSRVPSLGIELALSSREAKEPKSEDLIWDDHTFAGGRGVVHASVGMSTRSLRRFRASGEGPWGEIVVEEAVVPVAAIECLVFAGGMLGRIEPVRQFPRSEGGFRSSIPVKVGAAMYADDALAWASGLCETWSAESGPDRWRGQVVACMWHDILPSLMWRQSDVEPRDLAAVRRLKAALVGRYQWSGRFSDHLCERMQGRLGPTGAIR